MITPRRQINAEGLALIKRFEGCGLTAYPDPGSGGIPWTIGYGHTIGVKPGMIITEAQAEEFLLDDLSFVSSQVSTYFGACPLSDNQFSALVCFAYNVRSWRGSLLFQTVYNRKFDEAAKMWPSYDEAGGHPMLGLHRRRIAEAALFVQT